MDIKQAKQELRQTIRAYTARTEDGVWRIPREKQRPVLLMGPPGIGKTAILSQLAQEEHVGLVCYTMTHHTRQSALGLPVIVDRTAAGRQFRATEYTMSEIIASVYAQMEKTGLRTGILFLDEINCVSETLMPAILQMLQNKTFGVHALPEGLRRVKLNPLCHDIHLSKQSFLSQRCGIPCSPRSRGKFQDTVL